MPFNTLLKIYILILRCFYVKETLNNKIWEIICNKFRCTNVILMDFFLDY